MTARKDYMLFTTFAGYLQKLEDISARLEITAVLAELYRQLGGEERRLGSYLLQGSLVPEYESLEFMLSTKLVQRALAELMATTADQSAGSTVGQDDLFASATGAVGTNRASLAMVQKLFQEKGDLGVVTESVLSTAAQETSDVSIADVYNLLRQIALASGSGSQETKLRLLVTLLSQLDPISGKFVIRIILAKLRLGFSTMTMLDALSWAVYGDKRDHVVLEDAYQKQADIGRLAKVYLSAESDAQRATALAAYTVQAGVPIVPQLCQRLASPVEVVAKMGEVYVEPKYDGLRAQLHLITTPAGKIVKVFSRSLEDISHMFPEAQQLVTLLGAESAVLDGEAIGFDQVTGKLVPFQQTITRKRKHDVTETAAALPIKFFVYDVLSLNGQSLLDVPLRERKQQLRSLFADTEHLVMTEAITTSDPSVIQSYHEAQLAAGLEGVVIKQIDSPYQSGRKGWYWVKLKELAGMTGKLADTLDCVVMGYYYGQGKRTDFGIGAFLVGIRDKEQYVTIAKIGTGLTDEQFREIKQRCRPLETPEQPEGYVVAKGLVPAVWTKPGVVVEIAADEITKSPLHSAGVALRFPRLVRFRDDKTVEQITSSGELAGIAGSTQ